VRIATNSYMTDTKNNLARAQQDLRRLSRQLSTGKRLTRPSDDPTAVGWIVSARSDLANVLNQQKVLTRAKALIGPADAALDNIASALRGARDTVLGATQPGKDAAAHRADAAAIRSVRERVMDEANIAVQGSYLFAGRLSATRPFAQAADGAVAYSGDSSGVQLWVAPDRPLEVTAPGDRLFNFEDSSGARAVPGVDTDLFALLDQIATAIETGDDSAIPTLGKKLDALYEQVVEERGVLGARALRVEDAIDSAGEAELSAREILGDTEDVDIATALIDLQHQQLCYQAALAATSQLARIPSLFELGWT